MAENLSLDTDATREAFDGVTGALASLSYDDRATVLGLSTMAQPPETQSKVVDAIKTPFSGASQRTVDRLWFIVIGGLLFMGLLGAVLGFVLLLSGKDASASWALATAGVAGVVGLIAPSPLSSKNESGENG